MKKLNLLLTVGIIALFASCTTPGRLTYLKDMKYGQQYAAQKAPELKLQPEDKISIQVFSSDPQLAAPFNTTGGFTEGAQVSASQYTIDNQGNIDFPATMQTMSEIVLWQLNCRVANAKLTILNTVGITAN